MHKLTLLMTVFLATALLASQAGSMDIKSGNTVPGLRSICRAPDSWLSSALNGFPIVQQLPAFLSSQEKSLNDMAPGISSLLHSLPAGKGSELEGWILKASPRYL
ncbi:MAG TPA: hypothetical protein VMC84_07205 [Methanocella sp.]|uniref:hypothetical protein n=1 Tax=Methanocella sp. TaxID=2052833 RepID=UPI002CC97973|nr:hypothetical protein [Methanocella sp.]HTY90951.1 hypothetical protein [Methanocella sp.]